FYFFFSSRRRHTRSDRDWSSDVCSSDLVNYVAKHNYEIVTQDGHFVSAGQASDDVLQKLKSGKLAIRQKPGPTNALGLVKLMFPNEYHVYLHSTPSQQLFARARRHFSHGCIRVEKPRSEEHTSEL